QGRGAGDGGRSCAVDRRPVRASVRAGTQPIVELADQGGARTRPGGTGARTMKARKGYARAADIPADILSALSRGEMASATLSESLAIDQRMLLGAVFPE